VRCFPICWSWAITPCIKSNKDCLLRLIVEEWDFALIFAMDLCFNKLKKGKYYDEEEMAK
jgi:hypothetical protein